MADFEAWLVFLILVVNVVGELQRKRTLAASRGFLASARLSCCLSTHGRLVISALTGDKTSMTNQAAHLTHVLGVYSMSY